MANRCADFRDLPAMEVFSKANLLSAHLDQKRAEAFRKFAVKFEYGAGGFLGEFSKLSSMCVLGPTGIPF